MTTPLDNAEASISKTAIDLNNTEAAVDLNSTEACVSRLVNVFNGDPIGYDDGSPMDLFLKQQGDDSLFSLSNDEVHQRAAKFFLNGKSLPPQTPKPSMHNRWSYPVLRYIVFQELPDQADMSANESSIEQQPGTSEPEKKKPKRSSGPRNKPSFREICNLSSDLGIAPWLDCVSDRVRTRHSRSLEAQQQQLPIGALIRQIKKEGIQMKNEPMSVLLQFEQNLQPSAFKLPVQIKKETIEVKKETIEVKQEVVESNEEPMSVVSQTEQDIQPTTFTLPARVQRRKSRKNDENGKTKEAPESKKSTPNNKALKSRVNV